MKIGLIQTNPQDDFKKNISQIKNFIKKASEQNVDLVVLPETFTFMGPHDARFQNAKKNFQKSVDFLKECAQTYNIYIVGGSIDEFNPAIQEKKYKDHSTEKLFNTCFTISPSGHVISEYRKLHLFNLFDDNGKPTHCESEIYFSGFNPHTYPINKDTHWSALNIICYDVRFPEILRHLGETFDILFVPSAFTAQTGYAHWEVLLRARAIENQCYVVGCNQTGSFMNGQKQNYGNSMVIDPWGQVVARMGEEEGILVCEISRNEIKKSRSKVPALQDRKIF